MLALNACRLASLLDPGELVLTLYCYHSPLSLVEGAFTIQALDQLYAVQDLETSLELAQSVKPASSLRNQSALPRSALGSHPTQDASLAVTRSAKLASGSQNPAAAVLGETQAPEITPAQAISSVRPQSAADWGQARAFSAEDATTAATLRMPVRWAWSWTTGAKMPARRFLRQR